MCGVWLALEDIHPDAGPLTYYPGSHKWPIIYNDLIGKVIGDDKEFLAQKPYEQAWQAMVDTSGIKPEVFCPKKGQALIWAANLLHGGSHQKDPSRTRWSQVTHYYFDDCTYYTPAFSDPMAGNLDLREIVDISTGETVPNIYVDRPIGDVMQAVPGVIAPAKLHNPTGEFPADFDGARYLKLNPDVSLSGIDPKVHYERHGMAENRPYK